MVVQGFEVASCVWEKSVIKKLLNYLSLNAEALFCQIHQIIEAYKEFFFCLGKVAYLRKVDCYDTQGTCKFIRTEKSAAAFTKFALVETETAAH